jgi:DNA polymerase-3 subunit delta'
MSIPDLFWLAPQLEALRQARAQGRLPHALLIQDVHGGGGEELALLAAQVALCRNEPGACGTCADCNRAAARTHPDLWSVGLEEDSKQIKVEQIRELAAGLTLTGYESQSSVAIISPAEALNANAANALLKTLEEPRPGVLIVLVAHAASRLPATVISRCQRLAVRLPARAACLEWLRKRGGAGDWEAVIDVLGNAPLRALAVAPVDLVRVRNETFRMLDDALAGRGDAAAAAERWARDAFDLRLACAENWVTHRIAAQLAPATSLTELPTGTHLPAANYSMNMRGLVRTADALRELARLASTPVNKTLAVEQLLLQLPKELSRELTREQKAS